MEHFEIKSWITGEVLFSGEYDALKECVECGVKRGANLKGANLKGANLYGAYLEGAYLEEAYLCRANLCRANLKGANLEGAYLCRANLEGANLEGANLYRANLEGANLEGANLEGANLPHFQIIPEYGAFFGYKKLAQGVIVRVLIPEAAQRTSTLVGRKCRASHIKVVEVIEKPEGVTLPVGSTHNGSDILYNAGEIFYADSFDDDIRIECTHGIHFFMTLREARGWE